MSILNWELHQKLMEKRNKIVICTGIGLNMFFPEYTEVEIENQIDVEYKKNIENDNQKNSKPIDENI